jgi:hypothetical protein
MSADLPDMEDPERFAAMSPEQWDAYLAAEAERRAARSALSREMFKPIEDGGPPPTLQIAPRYQLAKEVMRVIRLRDRLERQREGSTFNWGPRIGRMLVDVEAGAMALAADDPVKIDLALGRLGRWES